MTKIAGSVSISQTRIRGSGSVPKSYGSATLASMVGNYIFFSITSAAAPIVLYFNFVALRIWQTSMYL